MNGWEIRHRTPTMGEHEIYQARERLLKAALRVLAQEREDPHEYADWHAEYADDQLINAAQELAHAHRTALRDAATPVAEGQAT